MTRPEPTRDQPDLPLRSAEAGDIVPVYRMLCDAVQEAVGDQPELAAFERQRFSPPYLDALRRAHPGHVLVVVNQEGKEAGFIVSAPEQGNMVLYWSYLKPAFRKGALAARALSEYVRFWDHRNYHKIIFFARTDKPASIALGRYVGFTEVAALKAQFFGRDFLLFEKMLDKTEPGFAPGVGVGLRGRLWWRFRQMFGG